MISIIEGGGTGKKVAGIFRKTLKILYNKELLFFSFEKTFGYRPHTFWELQKKYYKKDYSSINSLIDQEVKDLKQFYKKAHKETVGLFRTAINAQTLYYLRKDVKKIKFCILPIKTKYGTKRIIFIRDQLQGYYTNEQLKVTGGKIKASFQYRQENFLILSRIIQSIIKKYNIRNPEINFLYKFHLFGVELQRMIERAVKVTGVEAVGRVNLVQPDTGMHRLLGEFSGKQGCDDILVVASNEIGDVLLESLIHYYKLGTKETFYTLNFAFADQEKRLEVLQTMHGSADDIVDKETLNPIATVRAAAYAAENWLGIKSAESKMGRILRKKDVIRARNKTTDQRLSLILSYW